MAAKIKKGLYEKRTVGEWLASVSYDDDPTYVPSLFALQFVAFIKLVNGGEGEENLTPVIHLKMLDKLASGSRNVANMIFRGAGKTTLLAEYLILYIAVYGELPEFGKISVGLYISDSMENGVSNMRKNLESRIRNSEFLLKYIPEENMRFTDKRWEFMNTNGSKFCVRGFGAKSGVRGFKEYGMRPQIGIMDDLVSNEDSRSPTAIQSIKDTVGQAIKYALHPTKSKRIWLGTPFNANDPLYQAIESGAWDVGVYPVCEKFPCEESEFKGAWDDRFGYEYVSTMYEESVAEGNADGFYQELMLQIMSEEDRLVHDSDLQWYNSRDLLNKKDNFNFYIATDFATSEKESSDYSFISVWAVNHKGSYFWVDGICKRQTMDVNIDDLFTLVSKYNPMSVGVEVSGQQGGFISWIQREMFNRNIFFQLATNGNNSNPGIRPSGSKLERFNVMVPDFKLKRFFFPQDKKLTVPLKELILELSQASVGGFKSKHDDALDTVSMLALMQIWLPSDSASFVSQGDNLWGIEKEESYSSLNNYIV